MQLKPGYKQTEAGVIPEEWEIVPLGEAAEFLDGRRRPVKDSDRLRMRGDIPYYGASGIVDYVNAYIFDEDLILLGEDGENILSRNCRLAFKITGKSWVNNHAHVLRPKASMDIDYLVEFLESRDYAKYNTGTAQPKLNKLVCSRVPVFKPPLPEQHVIAEALSDVDRLLDGLDRLIAKKRAIKQGAAQQLLSGQRRLAGFGVSNVRRETEIGSIPSDWDVVSIGSVADILTGFPFPSGGYSEHGIRLLRGSNVKRGVTEWSVEETRHWPLLTADLRDYLLKAGDVVVAMDGSLVGRSFAVLREADVPALLLQRVARLRADTISQRFLAVCVCGQRFTDHCDAVKTVTAIPHISPSDLRSFTVAMPPTKEEQDAIAILLMEMEAEIVVLEDRFTKVRRVKIGMMQQLLTGSFRLL